MTPQSNASNRTNEVQLGAALLAFNAIADELGLSKVERDTISQQSGELDSEQVASFLSIYEEAGRLVGNARSWLTSRNTSEVFQGLTPIERILREPRSGLATARAYLAQGFGGWTEG